MERTLPVLYKYYNYSIVQYFSTLFTCAGGSCGGPNPLSARWSRLLM